MPQILESRNPDVVLPQEPTPSQRDHVVILDATQQATGFVVEWQISPDLVEVPES